MNEKMNFPNSFEEFIKNYEFKDNKEIYTNGCELIPTFRVMQGYEHYERHIREEVIDKIENLRTHYVDACNMCTLLNCEQCNINQFIEDLEQLKEQNK